MSITIPKSTKGGAYFIRDEKAIGNILKANSRLIALEENVAQKQLSMAQAEFLHTFGTEGTFLLECVPTKNRSRYRIVGGDPKTLAILKRNPGWLDAFSRAVKI